MNKQKASKQQGNQALSFKSQSSLTQKSCKTKVLAFPQYKYLSQATYGWKRLILAHGFEDSQSKIRGPHGLSRLSDEAQYGSMKPVQRERGSQGEPGTRGQLGRSGPQRPL